MKSKRLLISVLLILAILATSGLALWDLSRGLGKLNEALEEVKNTPPQQQALLQERCDKIPILWEQAESRFVLYVSHGTLDHLTQMIAELPALAQYQEYSHLYSHFDAITALLDDLWQSSVPSYRTLL